MQLKLANGATEEINNNRIVGQPIGIIYGYETDGLFVDQAEIDAAPEQLVSSRIETWLCEIQRY